MNDTILKAAQTVATALYDAGVRQNKTPAGAILYAKRRAFELNSSDEEDSAFYPYIVDALNTIEKEL